METDDRRTQLSGAVYRADAATAIALLRRKPWPETALQLIGDALTTALVQRIPDAPVLARDCAEQLRERAWEGDDELADQLDALLGSGPTPLLRPLPVDLDELADVLEGDPTDGDGSIDLETGQVWPDVALEYGEDDDDEDFADENRWLPVHNLGSHDGYLDMVDFIGTISAADRADRLHIAIQGRGAFRRFRDVLDRWPAEVQRWRAFSEDRRRGRARAWLAGVGYRFAPAERSLPQV